MKAKTATIKLDYPVQLADKMLEAVTMRRPSMGDLLDFPLEKGTLEAEMQLVGHLCGLKQEDLRLVDGEDYGKLQLQLITFRTGKSPRNTANGTAAQ